MVAHTDVKSLEIDNSVEMAAIFAALSNPARIDILRHIACHKDCGCKDITDVLPLAQSTVSQHIKVLVEAGILRMETIHPRSRYVINEHVLKDLANVTNTFLGSCCKETWC
jgi:DNA-binding transcriptional ArsR family regulator